MVALTVWKFDTVDGAGEVLSKLESLSKQQLITIEDAASARRASILFLKSDLRTAI